MALSRRKRSRATSSAHGHSSRLLTSGATLPPHTPRCASALCAFLSRASSFSKPPKLCPPSPLRLRNATLMFPNIFFDGLRAFANGLGTAADVRTLFFRAQPTASLPAATMDGRGDVQLEHGANDMSLQSNDAAAQSPSRDLLPSNPFSTSSPPSAPRQSRTVIDLSSPTRPSKRMRPQEEPRAAPRLPSMRKQPSADEKRLVGDYRYHTPKRTGTRKR
jgi:hypothetical protein